MRGVHVQVDRPAPRVAGVGAGAAFDTQGVLIVDGMGAGAVGGPGLALLNAMVNEPCASCSVIVSGPR